MARVGSARGIFKALRLCLPAGLCLMPAAAAIGSEPPPAPDAIRPTDQRDYSDSRNGCGPATLLNLLRFGGDGFAPALASLVGGSDGVRMRYLVDRYFRNRPSTHRSGQSRWTVHGIGSEDFAVGTNELLSEHGIAPLASVSLHRKEGEGEAEHLERVRELLADSLERGVPPVLNLRSYLVKRRDENGGNPAWEAGVGHYVLAVSLLGEPSGIGFLVEVIDPWQGRRTELQIHREANGQSFRAQRGTDEEEDWLDGRPFLQVLAPGVPSLRPVNLDWSDRFVVVANHLVGRL
jgi:hypothetical protein